MREILFRGKRIDNGVWIEGDLCLHGEDVKIFTNLDYPFGLDWYCVIPETIGQYTGLKDKNGKKVFEGDIILFDYVGKNLGVNGIESVIFENGKFGVMWGWHKEFVCLDGFANTTIEVIGNIHENKEIVG